MIWPLLVWAFAAVLLFPEASWAYVDPTTAGAFVQSAYLVVVSAVSAVFLFPRRVADLANRVRGMFRRSPAAGDGSPPSSAEN